MNRRGFLQLLIAAPFIPVLEKVEPFFGGRLEEFVAEPGIITTDLVSAYPLIERTVMGILTNGLIRPGGIERITLQPQRPFHPDRLMVAAISQEFDILHISATGEPQLEDAVPCAIFSEVAYGTRLEFGAIRPGEEIVLAVHNQGKEPQKFQAAFIGRTIR